MTRVFRICADAPALSLPRAAGRRQLDRPRRLDGSNAVDRAQLLDLAGLDRTAQDAERLMGLFYLHSRLGGRLGDRPELLEMRVADTERETDFGHILRPLAFHHPIWGRPTVKARGRPTITGPAPAPPPRPWPKDSAGAPTGSA